MGHVYLILEVDKNGDERYKVGITKNDPNKRLKQLQTGNPNRLSLLHTYSSENYKKVEQWLHSRFSAYSTAAKNEWFNLPSEEVAAFNSTCIKLNETIKTMRENNHFFK